MALFNFRWPGKKEDGESPSASRRSSRLGQPESVEVMRRRARHRLIGAAVLVLVGVVGFPMLFDTQPRPIPVDIPIEIPDRDKVAPLVVPGANAVDSHAHGASATPSSRVTPQASLGADEEEVPTGKPSVPALPVTPPVSQARPETKPEVRPEPKPEAKPRPEPAKPEKPKVEHKPEPKPEAKPEPKPEPKPRPEPKPEPARSDDAARARALLEGRSVPAATPAATDERFIVQVGAFAEASKAQEIRAKLELAGLKTFTQVVDTKDGKRTRVRVGPFNSKADADKAAARVKGQGLPASVLKL